MKNWFCFHICEKAKLTPATLQVTLNMIKSFKHKGLEHFYISGSKKGIQPEHSSKLERILDRLDASESVQDMSLPGYKLHLLSGNEKGVWSVWVNGNWRVTFFFKDGVAYVVDYRDYH